MCRFRRCTPMGIIPERNIEPENGFAGMRKDREFPIFSVVMDSGGRRRASERRAGGVKSERGVV